MNRINQRLAALKSNNKKALVTYIVSGDPKPDTTLHTMHALVANGADIIELGVPFSDPMAEGVVIQLGHERALTHNVSLLSTLAVVAEFRKQDSDTPVVLMGYANPIERMGRTQFIEKALHAGVDGLITVDLPPEEAIDFNRQLREAGLENIYLLAPTTSKERISKVLEHAGGFVYYVSVKGVTGAGHLDVESVREKLALIKEYTTLPICVGFGIKDGASAKAVAQYADGAVVGSVLVDKMGQMDGETSTSIASAVGELVGAIRKGLDSNA